MKHGMNTVPVRKLRILCFHGYLQNAKVRQFRLLVDPIDPMAYHPKWLSIPALRTLLAS